MISIIVPCKNRIESLTKCLDSIFISKQFAQSKLNLDIEVIVVNDNSNTGFEEEIKKRFPTVIIINSVGIGPGFARNFGLKRCKGEYVYFTDSDCTVAKDWVMNGYYEFQNSNPIVIQGIPWLFQKKSNEYLGSQEENLYKLLFSSYIEGSKSIMTDSRNLLIDKRLLSDFKDDLFFEKSEDATAESRVFAQRCISLGIKISWNSNLIVYHEDPTNILISCKQKYRHGSGRTEIWKEIPDFNYLRNRYFDTPIKNGIDKHYVISVHFSFLYGYYKNLDNKSLLLAYFDFIKILIEDYQCTQKTSDMIDELTNYLI